MKAALISAIAGMGAVTAPSAASDVYGLYNTGRSTVDANETGTLDVELHPCANDVALLCGTVRALRDQSDPGAPTTMPDGRPIVGFTMIERLEPRGPGKWRDGRINAVDESLDKGKMVWYGLKLDSRDEASVTLTGCLGFICPRKIVWRRVGDGAAPAGE